MQTGYDPGQCHLVSPIVPLLSSIKVLDESLLATHCPLVFDLRLPGCGLFVRRPRFPRSMIELDLPQKSLVNDKFAPFMSEADSLHQWGKAVEDGFNVVLESGIHESLQSLPVAFRGRCQPVAIVKCPIVSPIREACPSSFEPSSEIITIRTRRKAKQVRRLESLYRRLNKWDSLEIQSMKTWNEFLQEWQAIARSTAFGGTFVEWTCSFSDMDFPSWPLPSTAWVFEAMQLAMHFLRIAIHEDERLQSLRASVGGSVLLPLFVLDKRSSRSEPACFDLLGFSIFQPVTLAFDLVCLLCVHYTLLICACVRNLGMRALT